MTTVRRWEFSVALQRALLAAATSTDRPALNAVSIQFQTNQLLCFGSDGTLVIAASCERVTSVTDAPDPQAGREALIAIPDAKLLVTSLRGPTRMRDLPAELTLTDDGLEVIISGGPQLSMENLDYSVPGYRHVFPDDKTCDSAKASVAVNPEVIAVIAKAAKLSERGKGILALNIMRIYLSGRSNPVQFNVKDGTMIALVMPMFIRDWAGPETDATVFFSGEPKVNTEEIPSDGN